MAQKMSDMATKIISNECDKFACAFYPMSAESKTKQNNSKHNNNKNAIFTDCTDFYSLSEFLQVELLALVKLREKKVYV